MEFAGVKEWRIPEGNVMKVERNGVSLWEKPVTYDYGDGHLNTVAAGYNNVYYSTDDTNFQHYTMNVDSGGSNIYTTSLSSDNLRANRTFHKPSAGHNSIAYTVDATNEDMTFMAYGFFSGYTSSTQLSDFEIVIDGSARSLKYCVEHGLIKPIVLIASPWWVSNPTNLYYGQGYMSDGGWPEWDVLFMINKGHVMTALNCDFTSVGSGSTDGWNLSYCPTSQHRVVISY